MVDSMTRLVACLAGWGVGYDGLGKIDICLAFDD